MTKKLLSCAGVLPSHMEHQIPSLKEAERRGWEVWFAVEGHWMIPYLVGQGFRKERMVRTGGYWRGRELIMPQAQSVFANVRPDAAFLTPSGHGLPGGAWLEECFKRRVPAVEFSNGCHPVVWWHGLENRKHTKGYVKVLRAKGYGLELHSHVCDTPVQQWLGLPMADRLGEITRRQAWVALGISKPYVLAAPQWARPTQPDRAVELSADLAKWEGMARANGKALVYSLHPNVRYAPLANEPVKIPKRVIPASSWPGEVWGGDIRVIPAMSLVEHADFVIHNYASGHVRLCLAAKATQWIKRDMHVHSKTMTQEMADEAFGGIPRPQMTKHAMSLMFDVRQQLAVKACRFDEVDMERYKAHFFLPWYWRGEDNLEALFSGDLSGLNGTDEEWRGWCSEFELRVDGKVAERVVDLLE